MIFLSKNSSLTFFGALCFFITFFTCAMPHLAQAEVDIIKVSTFEQDLENIETEPTASAKNILKAKDLYFATFSEQDSPETRDAAFLVFNKYFLKIADNTYKDEAFYNLSVMDESAVDKGRELAATYGLRLAAFEGSYIPIADNNYLAKTFGKYLSPSLMAYLAFMKKNEYLAQDAGLNVSFEELRAIIILGEAIVTKYPETSVADLVQKQLNSLVYLYLHGLPNTPVYEYKNLLLSEVKTSYKKFLKENKKSTYYPIVKFIYDLLEKNNFIYTKQVQEKLQEKAESMNISL